MSAHIWRNSYFVPENLEASVDRADALKPLVLECMTLPEMALRFILSNPAVGTVIPGMRKLKNIRTPICHSRRRTRPPRRYGYSMRL